MADKTPQKEGADKDLEARLGPYAKQLKNGAVVINQRANPLMYAIGWIESIDEKIMFGSTKWGRRPSQETVDQVVKNVEQNEYLKNATIRFDHAAPITDTLRLFTDKRLKEEVPLYMRWLSVPETLIGGFLSYLFRQDHYNAATHTVHVYSDIPAIALHEVGHADNYAGKYHFRLPYAVLGSIPIIGLIQEGIASKYAHQYLPESQKYQTGRFLFPAFGTYIGAATGIGIIPGLIGGHIVGALYNAIRRSAKKEPKETPKSQPAPAAVPRPA